MGLGYLLILMNCVHRVRNKVYFLLIGFFVYWTKVMPFLNKISPIMITSTKQVHVKRCYYGAICTVFKYQNQPISEFQSSQTQPKKKFGIKLKNKSQRGTPFSICWTIQFVFSDKTMYVFARSSVDPGQMIDWTLWWRYKNKTRNTPYRWV